MNDVRQACEAFLDTLTAPDLSHSDDHEDLMVAMKRWDGERARWKLARLDALEAFAREQRAIGERIGEAKGIERVAVEMEQSGNQHLGGWIRWCRAEAEDVRKLRDWP